MGLTVLVKVEKFMRLEEDKRGVKIKLGKVLARKGMSSAQWLLLCKVCISIIMLIQLYLTIMSPGKMTLKGKCNWNKNNKHSNKMSKWLL